MLSTRTEKKVRKKKRKEEEEESSPEEEEIKKAKRSKKSSKSKSKSKKSSSKSSSKKEKKKKKSSSEERPKKTKKVVKVVKVVKKKKKKEEESEGEEREEASSKERSKRKKKSSKDAQRDDSEAEDTSLSKKRSRKKKKEEEDAEKDPDGEIKKKVKKETRGSSPGSKKKKKGDKDDEVSAAKKASSKASTRKTQSTILAELESKLVEEQEPSRVTTKSATTGKRVGIGKKTPSAKKTDKDAEQKTQKTRRKKKGPDGGATTGKQKANKGVGDTNLTSDAAARRQQRAAAREARRRAAGKEDIKTAVQTKAINRGAVQGVESTMFPGLMKAESRQVRRPVKVTKPRYSANKETIETLLESLNNRTKFQKMVEYSLECLKNLAVSVVDIQEMIDLDVLPGFQKVMEVQKDKESIQQLMNDTLLAFAWKKDLPELLEPLGKGVGSKGVCYSMLNHSETKTVIGSARVSLKMLTEESMIEPFVETGGIEAAARMLNDFPDSEEACSFALQLMNRLTDDPRYVQDAWDSGCVDAVFAALKRFPHNEELVDAALRLVPKFCQLGESQRKYMRDLGAVDTIVDAVETHPDNEEILDLGGQCLAMLADSSDLEQALRDLLSDNYLKRAAALAKIASLLLVEENIDLLLKQGGLKWLIRAMKAAMKEKPSETIYKILSLGSRALGRLATDEDRIYKIMEAGGVKLLVNIMKKNPDIEDVACSAMAALTRMVTRRENAVFIVDSGAVEAAAAVLEAQPKSERVATNILRFFSALSVHRRAAKKVVENNGIQSLSLILKKWVKKPEIILDAFKCIDVLSNRSSHIRIMAQEGIPEHLLAIMGHYVDNVDVLRPLLELIRKLCVAEENQRLFSTNGMVKQIKNVMKANKDDSDLIQLCKATLASISGKDAQTLAVDELAKLAELISADPAGAAEHLEEFKKNLQIVLDAIASGDHERIRKIVRNGGVEALLAALHASSVIPDIGLMEQIIDALKTVMDVCPEVSEKIIPALKRLYDQAVVLGEDMPEMAELVTSFGLWLAERDPNLALLMAKEGLLEQSIDLGQALIENVAILMNVTKAMDAMIQSDDLLVKRSLDSEGHEVLLEALFISIDDPEELTRIIQLLKKHILDEDSANKLWEAGLMDALVEAMNTHPKHEDVMNACATTLARLGEYRPLHIPIMEHRLVKPFLKAIRHHYKDEELVEALVMILDEAAHASQPCRRRLMNKKLQAAELIKWIVDAYPDNKKIRKHGKRLHECLSGPTKEELAAERERRLRLLLDQELDAESCDIIFDTLEMMKLDREELKIMLANLLIALQDPEACQLMLDRGGLQKMANMMQQYKDDPEIMALLAAVYMRLIEHAGMAAANSLDNVLTLADLLNLETLSRGDLTRIVQLLANMDLTPEMIQALLDANPFQNLFNILLTSDDPILLAAAARLLAKLSNHDGALAMLSKMADLRALIRAMRKHMDKPEFLRYAVYLLANLAVNEELKDLIGVEGGIQVIIEIMHKYRKNGPLVDNCTYALANLSEDNEVNCSFIMACDGISKLVAALQRHPTLVDMLEQAMNTLSNLCMSEIESNKDAVLESGAPSVIAETLLANLDQEDMAGAALTCLGNITHTPEAARLVIQSGAVQAIVAVLASSDSPDTKLLALQVLTNLAAEDDPESMAQFNQEGAVQAVCKMVEDEMENLELEMATLLCISNLCRDRKNAKLVIDMGIIDAIVLVLNELGHEEEVVAVAFQCLSVLSLCSSRFSTIIEAGAVTAVMLAVRTFIEHDTVIRYGLAVIGNLCHDEESAETVAKEGPITLCLTLMRERADTPEVLLDAFICLSGLCRAANSAISMSEMSMNALSDALSQHSAESPEMVIQGLAFLSNLCVHREATESVVDTDLVPQVLKAMATHDSDSPLLVVGCKALENMAHASQAVRDFQKQEGCLEALQDIADLNPGRGEIIRAVRAAITAIKRQPIGDVEFKDIALSKRAKKRRDMLTGEVRDDTPPPELDEEHRNLLLAGGLLMKHKMGGAPHVRQVWITQDWRWFCWVNPKKVRKEVDRGNQMKVAYIRSVDIGRCTPTLRRKRFGGKYYAKEECAFAVVGRKRTVDLEAESEELRDKWVEALLALKKWRKDLKEYHQKFRL